jgi:hypothetical protein
VLIEHTFVTTLEPQSALAAASQLLAQGGFAAERNDATPSNEKTLQMHRGRAGARDATELPQRIHLQWDRGRINLAAFIDSLPQHRSFSRSIGSTVLIETRAVKQKKKLNSDLMIAISRAVELLLAGELSPEDAGRDWLASESKIKAASRQVRLRNRLCWSCLVLFIITMVGFVHATAHR